nr:LysR family transcriptional regulator [uncultured Cupriavidus sp.]
MPDKLPENLGGIATFVATATSNSFTEAAARLGVSKSAVGKSVAKLEDRLGVQLFHRSTRKLALTTDGEALYAACSAALSEIAAAQQALARGEQAPSGPLRVDMPVSFGRKFMMPALSMIAKEHPGLELTLTFSDHLVDPIDEGVDLQVRFGEIQDSSDLVARFLVRLRRVLCAAPDYLESHGVPRTLEDLDAHVGIVMLRRRQPLEWSFAIGEREVRYLPPVRHNIGDGDALIDAAVSGLGICQFPHALVREHIDAGRLITVLDSHATEVNVHVLWPRTARMRPKIRYTVDRLVEMARNGFFGQ